MAEQQTVEVGTLTLGQWRVLEPHVQRLQEAQRGLNLAIAALGLPTGCAIDQNTGAVTVAAPRDPRADKENDDG